MKNQQSAFAKTKAQINFAFVFATRIVQFVFYLNPKFQVSNLFLRLFVSNLVGNPDDRFSFVAAQFILVCFQVPTLLRSITNEEILSLRQQTQFLWDTYFASVDKIVTATLEVIMYSTLNHSSDS